MLAIFTAMVGIATTYPPGARFMTFVVGIPAIGLCLLQLALDLYRRRAPAVADSRSELEKAQEQASRLAGRRIQFEMPSENVMFTEGDLDPKERVRRELIAWGYFLGLIACILLFGFRITVPVFLIAFLRFQAGASWRSALLYGGGGALAMYVLFERRVAGDAAFGLRHRPHHRTVRLLRGASLRRNRAVPIARSRIPGTRHAARDVASAPLIAEEPCPGRNCISLAAAGLIAAAIATPAPAQSGADFFKGKTVTYIVATAAGGGYDLYGRLVAEYMQRYLPGSTFIVRNLPGAGHLVGTNTIFASRPDGLTIGTFNTGLIYNQLVGLPGMKFDLTKMSWIGKATTDPRVMAISQHSPIKTYAELVASKDPVNMAVSGVGSANYVETTMLASALKWPAKILTGYNGNDDQLAMRRGEVVGTLGSRSSFDQFVKNGYGRFIFQIGGKDTDAPQLRDLVKDPAALSLIALVQSQGDLARLTAGPPGIPKPQLDALREAYRKALEDKELQEKAAKLERPVEPGYGDDVLNAIVTALKQPPETVALLASALKKK